MDWKQLEELMQRLDKEFPANEKFRREHEGGRSNCITLNEDGRLTIGVWYEGLFAPFIFNPDDDDYKKTIDRLIDDFRAYLTPEWVAKYKNPQGSCCG